MSSFIGTVLPKISSMKTKELFSGNGINRIFHFHKIKKENFSKIKKIMQTYSYDNNLIDQILDGENLYQFAGNIEGKSAESRVICEYRDNGILYLLFFDTNHHISLYKNKAGESFSYSECPFESYEKCKYMYNCFAKEYLDYEKIEKSMGNSYVHSEKQ